MISTQFRQQHFQLYEIILPYCTVCTPISTLPDAWHTPVTCEESSDATYSLWLSSPNVPQAISQPTPSINIKSILNSQISRCVSSSSESTAKLKAGEGLASRSTMSLTCSDFAGDPGPINFSEEGTFFGKLRSRNILDGKKIITHYYAVAGPVNQEVVVVGPTSTHFITSTSLSNGVFTLNGKDALKDIEALSQKFPDPSEVVLTADIDENVTLIPVSDFTKFTNGSVFRIDDELLITQAVTASSLTVETRGTDLINIDGTVVFRTGKSSHSVDSTAQPCYLMNKKPLWDVLNDIYTAAGLTDFIDYAQWQAEIEEWNKDAILYGVLSEPDAVSNILDMKLFDYLVDMWLDQPSQKLKVSAVTAWKQAIRILEEGNDVQDLKILDLSDKRFSRAMMYNKKDFKTASNDITNFSRLTISTDTAVEVDDFYGDIKLKELEPSDTITINSAQTTVARFVQRFSRAPKKITFTMEERKLAGLNLSDIVDIVSRDSQTPSGQALQARDRAQIISIQPKLNEIGRRYNVEAISYIPLIASDPGEDLVITLSGTLFDVNLFARAGAPNIPINVTFILDGCTIGSTAYNIPAMRAGNFEPGSMVTIICTNNTKWSAKGGENYGANLSNSNFVVLSLNGQRTNGADSYTSDGIPTSIYLNYGTVSGYATSAELYASGGAGQSYTMSYLGQQNEGFASGGGGSGITFGQGGIVTTTHESIPFIQGGNGTFNSGGTAGSFLYLGIPLAWFLYGGAGSFSLDGLSGSVDPHDPNYSLVNVGSPTLAGGAIRGNSVTVYNLAAQSSKFRDGNSSPYTLVNA